MKKVILFNFSFHIDGNGDQLIDFISQHIDASIEVIRFASLQQIHGCGQCQYDCFSDEISCPYYHDDMVQTYAKIADADFCYMIIPNYSGVPCSSYFMFRERSQCIWQDEGIRRYYQTPKHFLIFSNTDHDVFTQLLKNEVSSSDQLAISFFSSNDIHCKSVNGHIMQHRYFQEKMLQILKQDGFYKKN